MIDIFDIKLKLKEEELQDLYQEFNNYYTVNEGANKFIKFLEEIGKISIDQSSTYRACQLYSEKNIFIKNRIKLLKNIEITFIEINDFYNVPSEILINFCKNDKSAAKVFDTLKTIVNSDNGAYCFYNLYWEGVKHNIINPMQDRNLLDIILKKTFNYDDYNVEKFQEEINKTKENALLYILNSAAEDELKKLYYCEYLENVGSLDLKNPKIKKIYDNYEKEDFSNFYKDYNVIRNIYKNSNEEDEIQEMKSTVINFHLLKKAAQYNMSVESYSSSVQRSFKFLEDKAKEILEIDRFIMDIGKIATRFYINYYDKSEKINDFAINVINFTDLWISDTQQKKAVSGVSLSYDLLLVEEMWNNIILYQKMNKDIEQKETSRKKKI